jgi:hypothetical protein
LSEAVELLRALALRFDIAHREGLDEPLRPLHVAFTDDETSAARDNAIYLARSMLNLLTIAHEFAHLLNDEEHHAEARYLHHGPGFCRSLERVVTAIELEGRD